MTITQAPILLGDGISLIAKTSKYIMLEGSIVAAYANDFIQIKYTVNYL